MNAESSDYQALAQWQRKGEQLMPRTCTACTHSERTGIDEALLSGEPLRNIAERVSVSVTSLFRHKAHLSETLKKSREVAEVSRADSLIDQLRLT
jgi:hypothetical protein